ncbi:GNAT family N-acetyltransferase [Leucobacter coleopterorum]|uniref:GNAT family N-acetyltransferase n=1 Tax=Leucobacter coleopterorum TaxID=2714933 RepID=A0ABX6JXY5_9MICO|nr:GNAT family N-acetyltransferase [Leucobacter coleopterorum]QIM19179.1 GNAT family N-acetyltransferase [Leucobacter coleopterorum]
MIQSLSLPTILDTRAGPITLRRAHTDDIAAVLGFLYDDPISQARGDSYDPADRAVYVGALEEIAQSPQNELVVAENAEGTVVGCLQLTTIPGLSRRGGTRLLVESVHVASQFQSSGIGGAMMKWVMEVAAPAVGAAMIQLTSDKSRKDAHRFYLRLGFIDSHAGFKHRVG